MWKNFYTKKTDLNTVIQSLEDWKKAIFNEENLKVKEYFATKVVVYFDNMMIFHQKKGLHNNLLDSLGLAEKEMSAANLVFKPINFYLIKEEAGFSLLTSGLNLTEGMIDLAKELGFKLIESDFGGMVKLEELKFNSWATLVFDFELVNFSQNWINYTPTIEERSRLQAEHILYNMSFKKTELSMVEKIKFEENITKHPQYQELLDKVLKVMPKIESSLEQEWRTKIITLKDNVVKEVKENKEKEIIQKKKTQM
jgi:hypothetical protein